MSAQLSSHHRLRGQAFDAFGQYFKGNGHDINEIFEFAEERNTRDVSFQPQLDTQLLIEKLKCHKCDAEHGLGLSGDIRCCERAHSHGIESEMTDGSSPTLLSSPSDLKASPQTPTPSSPTLAASPTSLPSSPQTLVSTEHELGTWIPIKWSLCTKCGYESERWNARYCTDCGYRRAVIHEPKRDFKSKVCTNCRYKYNNHNARVCGMCGHDREEICKPEGDFKWRYCTECNHEHEEYETRFCTQCGLQREVFSDHGREVPCLQNQVSNETVTFVLRDESELPSQELYPYSGCNDLCKKCGHDRCRNPYLPPEPVEPADPPEKCNKCGYKDCGDLIPPECTRSCGYEECAECDGLGVVSGHCGHSKCASCLEGFQSGRLPTKLQKKEMCRECGMKGRCRGLKSTEMWEAEWDEEDEEDDENTEPIKKKETWCESCPDCKVVFGEVNWGPGVKTSEWENLGPLDKHRQWVEYDQEFSDTSRDQVTGSQADSDENFGFETLGFSEEQEARQVALENRFGFGSFDLSDEHSAVSQMAALEHGFGKFGLSGERDAHPPESDKDFEFSKFGDSF